MKIDHPSSPSDSDSGSSGDESCDGHFDENVDYKLLINSATDEHALADSEKEQEREQEQEHEKEKEQLSDDDFEDDSKQNGASAGRYFSEKEDKGPACHNCGGRGHLVKECPEPSRSLCFLCGQPGHQRNDCPNDLCYNCMQPGHQSRDCTRPKRRRFVGDNEYCNACGMQGHLQRDCSLVWRQYVFCAPMPDRQTLEASIASKIVFSCYNCGADDHFGDECGFKRTRPGYSIFHRPYHDYLRQTVSRVKLAVCNSGNSKQQFDKTQKPKGKGIQKTRSTNSSPKKTKPTPKPNTKPNAAKPNKQNKPKYKGGYVKNKK